MSCSKHIKGEMVGGRETGSELQSDVTTGEDFENG